MFVYDATKPYDESSSTEVSRRRRYDVAVRGPERAPEITEEKVRGMSVREKTADHPAEIDLLVSVRNGQANAAYRTWCETSLDARPRPLGPDELFAPPDLVSLVYAEKADGTFGPTAETTPRLKRFLP